LWQNPAEKCGNLPNSALLLPVGQGASHRRKVFYFIGVFHPKPRMLDFIDKEKTLSIKPSRFFYAKKKRF
jgi:hypothetical protein